MHDANESGHGPDIGLSDDVLYRNWEEERHNRLIQFRPAAEGTLQYKRIPMCGHKFTPGREPRHRNCEPCWFTLFSSHKDLVESCDEVFKSLGENTLRKIRGPKFAKNFLRFMGTLAQWKKAADAAKGLLAKDVVATIKTEAQ